MNFTKKALATATAGAALTLAGLPVLAQPSLDATTLGGDATDASFSGGATTDDGSSFTDTVSPSTAVDVTGTVNVDPAHVGQQGGLAAIVQIPGMGAFKKLSGGLFLPWDGTAQDLQPFAQKTLSEQESFTVFDDLVGQYSNLQGLDFQVFLGYYTDSVNNMVYTESPISFSISEAPADGGSAPCPDTTNESSEQFEGKDVCVISGTVTEDTHFTSNNVYLLDGAVFIGGDNQDSATLTIDPGTKVIAPVGLNFLVINRGSKIEANGTAAEPIVFTYEDEANATPSTTGQWGGLILNGNAPINACSEDVELCEVEGEGSTGLYGGNDPQDDSGTLSHVIVKHAGQNITEDNELNGIAFQGTGSGTVVNNIQVHLNSDDGVEFFGGTTNAKNLVLTSNEDDSLDWTHGWQGNVQNVIIRQKAGTGDRGIEADNLDGAHNAQPRSGPTIANMTIIGDGDGQGVLFRRGTGVRVYNSIITGASECVDLDNEATFNNGGSSATDLSGELVMEGVRVDCPTAFVEEDGDPWSVETWFTNQPGNTEGSVELNGYVNTDSINELEAQDLPDDSFFTPTDHIGAVSDATADWAAEWIYTDWN